MGNESSANVYASDSSEGERDDSRNRMFIELDGGVVSADAGE